MSVENLLKNISVEMNVLKTARERYAKQLAPDFSVFNYIYDDEPMLSKIIADFLNPKGIHAQGNVFLKLFFEQFGLGEIWQDKGLDTAQVEVKVEALTDLIERKDRRMDILIRFNNSEYAVCIENKPFAADQDKQLEDYAKHLDLLCKKNQQNWHLIYLSGYGTTPDKKSIDLQKLKDLQDTHNFSQINYPHLVDWLRQCVAVCQSPKVVNFLNEFQQYILSVFEGVKDMSEQDAIVQLILNKDKPEYLKAATEVFLAKDVIQDKLVKKLYQQLAQSCEEKNWFINGELIREKASGISICFSNRPQELCFKLVLEGRDYRSCSVGLHISEEKNAGYYDQALWQNIHTIMKDKFLGQIVKGGAKTKGWPFWIEQKDIWNWQTDHRVWPMIQSGDLCSRIMNYAQQTYNALKENGLLDKL